MLRQPPSRLLEALRSLGHGPPGADGADAALLGKFVEKHDQASFEAVLRRHGEMVMRICRRHLGAGPDAEDAFQAVFLVLARDASRIGNRESLAGWLFRVAYYVSRKAMGRNQRRRCRPIRDEDCPRAAGPEALDRDELRAEVEREVNSLPDKLRAPVVLCYLEGYSNSEAAALLGIPKGTVDSRLSSARSRLRTRLGRRGFAISSAAAFETLRSNEANAAMPSLIRHTLDAAMSFVKTGDFAGTVSRKVFSLVAGVAPTMSNHRLSLMLLAVLLLVTAGGTGLSVFNANAEGRKPTPQDKKPDKANAEAPPAAPVKIAELKTLKANETIYELLKQPLGMDEEPPAMTLKELLAILQSKFGVPIRIDLAAFSRIDRADAGALYGQRVGLPVVRGMTLSDALNDVLAQLSHGDVATCGLLAYRVRKGQIIIVPAFKPTVLSVGVPPSDQVDALIPVNEMIEQEEGEPVSLSIDERSMLDVLRDLRESTGANIVLDVRQKDKAKQTVSATLHDVRLMAALRVLGDMCDLQPVALNNVFYVTSKENAEKLQKEIDHRRYGNTNLQAGGIGLPPGAGIGGVVPGAEVPAQGTLGTPAPAAPIPNPANPNKPNSKGG